MSYSIYNNKKGLEGPRNMQVIKLEYRNFHDATLREEQIANAKLFAAQIVKANSPDGGLPYSSSIQLKIAGFLLGAMGTFFPNKNGVTPLHVHNSPDQLEVWGRWLFAYLNDHYPQDWGGGDIPSREIENWSPAWTASDKSKIREWWINNKDRYSHSRFKIAAAPDVVLPLRARNTETGETTYLGI